MKWILGQKEKRGGMLFQLNQTLVTLKVEKNQLFPPTSHLLLYESSSKYIIDTKPAGQPKSQKSFSVRRHFKSQPQNAQLFLQGRFSSSVSECWTPGAHGFPTRHLWLHEPGKAQMWKQSTYGPVHPHGAWAPRGTWLPKSSVQSLRAGVHGEGNLGKIPHVTKQQQAITTPESLSWFYVLLKGRVITNP